METGCGGGQGPSRTIEPDEEEEEEIKTYNGGKTSDAKTHGLNAFKIWQYSQRNLGHIIAQSDAN